MNDQHYLSYDYKELKIREDMDLRHLDALECFGWEIDTNKSTTQKVYVLKRLRHIVNKTELIRLERNLDSCLYEIAQLQKSIDTYAAMAAITVGMIGTVFIALSTFAIVNDPPLILPCIVLAVPGFIGWLLPYFIWKYVKERRRRKIMPFVEKKYDEIDQICNKAIRLRE